MKDIKTLFSLVLILLSVGCSVKKEQKMGHVVPANFEYKTNFTTFKTVIILPMEMDGIEKNFLFDTGAQLTVIHRDSIIGKSSSITGATSSTVKGGSEIVKSLKFGSVDFINTFATNTNMTGINDKIPNFGGIIGQSIISKANWLIDYPNKTIKISNKNLAKNYFQILNLKIEDGRPYTFISIDGSEHKVIIDSGDSKEFTIPEESKLAKELLNTYEFTNRSRESNTIGDLSTISDKIATLPLIKLGTMEFKDVEATITKSNNTRIGIGFFKDYQIYIDNTNSSYKIKKQGGND